MFREYQLRTAVASLHGWKVHSNKYSLHPETGANPARQPVGRALGLDAPQEQQQQLEGRAEPVGGRPERRAGRVAEAQARPALRAEPVAV